jgi:hypothetical protein
LPRWLGVFFSLLEAGQAGVNPHDFKGLTRRIANMRGIDGDEKLWPFWFSNFFAWL